MTEYGERLHAVTGKGRGLCGVERQAWYPPDPNAEPCDFCGACYGVGFPAPPGREHRSANDPWFGEYAAQRASYAATTATP